MNGTVGRRTKRKHGVLSCVCVVCGFVQYVCVGGRGGCVWVGECESGFVCLCLPHTQTDRQTHTHTLSVCVIV